MSKSKSDKKSETLAEKLRNSPSTTFYHPDHLGNGVWNQICNVDYTPPTQAEREKMEKKEKKEKIRRAKKITITVGEYEDLKNNQYDYDW